MNDSLEDQSEDDDAFEKSYEGSKVEEVKQDWSQQPPLSRASSQTFNDKNVRRLQLPFLKYWPTKDHRELWAEYV